MILKNKIFIFLLLIYLSLIFGFYFGEDAIGGAYNDYKGMEHIALKFKENLLHTLFNYNTFGHRHSPVFYIIKSLALYLDEIGQRIFFLHLYLLIPLFFYKCLKIKFKNVSKNYLKLFAGIIILLPTFRGYSIWPDPHLLGVLFFIISIYFYLKFKENKYPLKNALISTLLLSFAAYASPNFGIFVIFFFYEFIKKFSFSKEIVIIFIINIFLALPFFFYVFYLDINFIFNNNGWDIGDNFYSTNNISNKIIIISSLILFYLIPLKLNILIFNISKLKFINFSYQNLFIISLFFLIIYFFDFSTSYELTNSGGGFFYNISNYLFANNYFLYFVFFFIFSYLIKNFYSNFDNLIIFLCFILSNPQVTLWQANFSPTIFILIFLLFKGIINKNDLNFKTLVTSYAYFILYFVANIAFRIILI